MAYPEERVTVGAGPRAMERTNAAPCLRGFFAATASIRRFARRIALSVVRSALGRGAVLRRGEPCEAERKKYVRT